MKKIKKYLGASTIIIFGLLAIFFVALAAEPTLNNWFQLRASPFTGADDTGDGGTGNPTDYNYFYVGQTFTANIQIKSEHTNAANIWIDYDPVLFDAFNLTTGTYFDNWAGQTITSGRIKSTGFNLSGNSSGLSPPAGFGSVDFSALRPTAVNYGIGSPATLIINVGTIGSTTESNISYLGNDILEEVENFNLHIWADTKAPYLTNPSPNNGANNVNVTTNLTFELRDSKNGVGDNSGVGTGVNTAMTYNSVLISNQLATTSYTANTSFACSGIWGTNLCLTTVSPLPPSAIPGDTRRWDYNTLYTVQISGFRDYASNQQDQLGDANGPNYMATTTFSFTTESDTTKPTIQNKNPSAGATGVSINATVVFDVVDKKSANVSGTGVNPESCSITISSPSFGPTTYQHNSAGVVINPVNYGYRFTITPISSFGQNETVTVNIHDCQDLAETPNIMVTDIYTFITSDNDAPYVDDKTPGDDQAMLSTETISFRLKDNGSGIDLTKVVIYLNGHYYTLNGGAGVVTSTGTKITFANSFRFSGNNYIGDPTTYSCADGQRDCLFVLKPENNFIIGESVPVIIYANDLAGNLMERVVYAPVIRETDGSIYCGENTIWDASLNKCLGSGGGSGPTCVYPTGGGSSMTLVIDPQSVSATQISRSSVLVTWRSSLPSSNRVVYDEKSVSQLRNEENYGYQFSTKEFKANNTYHAVIVSGLKSGRVYYFRPIVKNNSLEVYGPEVVMTPKFTIVTSFFKETYPTSQDCPTISCPVCPIIDKTEPIEQTPKEIFGIKIIKNVTDIGLEKISFQLAIALLIIIIIIIAVGSLTLRLFRYKLEEEYPWIIARRRWRISLLILTIIAILILAILFLINQETNFWSKLLTRTGSVKTINLTGRIIDPTNLQGVENVDLVNGHTAIRTSNSGQYIFDQVPIVSGLKLTAPGLTRALIILPPTRGGQKNMNIYFNQEMYNTLIEFIDLEARGHFRDNYEYLAKNIKSKMSFKNYEKKVETIFTAKNISDQELIIKEMSLIDRLTKKDYDLVFSKVVQITISANGQDAQYHLVKEVDGWKIIK